MKTFNDLEFKDHPMAMPYFNKQARMDFDNGYGLSVINGRHAYCDETTYEVAVLYNGEITYDSGLTDDVLGYQTPKMITELMEKIQNL